MAEDDKIRVFQLNDEAAEFEELEIDPEMKLAELLKSNLILYFVDAGEFPELYLGRIPNKYPV